jgi:hypothetical protein
VEEIRRKAKAEVVDRLAVKIEMKSFDLLLLLLL